jgi:uncharacterized protein YgfB (UPF0149 family)
MEYYLAEEQALDFDEFADQLLEQGEDQSPSHLHGAICGVLAGGGEQDPEYCLAAIAQALAMDIHGELAANCVRLARASAQGLMDEEFDFHLFIPDDETEVELRVRALADWCSGFLAGYALAIAQPQTGALDDDSAEVLKDMAAIAEATDDAELDPEETESHLFELTEYLRFACLNLFADRLLEPKVEADPDIS